MIRTERREAKFDMDDKSKHPGDPVVECPSCHLSVPEKGMTFVMGRQLCLSCAGAWFVDEDGGED